MKAVLNSKAVKNYKNPKAEAPMQHRPVKVVICFCHTP